MWSARSSLYCDTDRLNGNRQKKIYPVDTNNKKTGMSILMLDKVDLLTKFLSKKWAISY